MPKYTSEQFLTTDVGSEVFWQSRSFRITHILSVDTALGIDTETGQSLRLPIDELQSIQPSKPADTGGLPSFQVTGEKILPDYDESEWKEAQRRMNAIKDLIDDPMRSHLQVQTIAKREGVHPATLYRWMKLFMEAGHVSALVPTRRGRKHGTRMLETAVEAIIETAIEKTHLHKQMVSPQTVIDEVLRLCRLAKVVPPHPNTVRMRLRRLPPAHTLKRRGQKEEAINRFTPIRGSFPDATHPFAVIQIDHTKMDIIAVDEIHRLPVARPWITLAIDVFSRMVAGLYISFDEPNAAAVGLCIAHAMCTKREYLANLGVAGQWPVWGRIATIHCDNAREFRGIALERGCEEYGTNLSWRPVKTPRYGGHIERLVGTLMRELHKLPGTTFSNISMRKNYDSDKNAVLTLKEIERHVIDFIVNIYHQRVHAQLGIPPVRKWENGLRGDGQTSGIGIMPVPDDPARIALDFMPIFERTIQRYGIRMDGITYYDPVLDRYINAISPTDTGTKHKFTVRRDPRDISKVYFFDPEDRRYTVIPYLNLGNPAVSVREFEIARKKLREEGQRQVDESVVFEAVERMRNRVEDAMQKSKTARRQAQRNPGRRDHPDSGKTTSRAIAERFSLPKPAAIPRITNDDPFAEPVIPFEDRSVQA